MVKVFQFQIPKYLSTKRLPMLNNNPLKLLGEKYRLKLFSEISDTILKKCYFDNFALYARIIDQLAFYGVVLQGELQRYSVLHRNTDSFYLWKESVGERLFKPAIPPQVLRKANAYGVVFEADALRLPLASFVKCQKDFPFEKAFRDCGFTLIDYNQLVEIQDHRILQHPVKAFSALNETIVVPFRQGYQNVVPESFSGVAQFPARLRVAGYDDWDEILEDMEKALSAGEKTNNGPLNKAFKLLRDNLKPSANNEIDDDDDTHFKIRLEGKVRKIPLALNDKPIVSADFSKCKQVPDKLTKLGYTNWRDLPFDLDSLLSGISGIGPGAISKFGEAVNSLFTAAFLAEGGTSSVIISYGNLQLSLPQASLGESLASLLDYSGGGLPDSEFFAAINIRTLRDIPCNFGDLERKLPKHQVFELFDRLCQVFCPDLSLKARILLLTSAILAVARSQNIKGIQRVCLILKSKFNLLEKNKTATWKDVGAILGVTGERVRQIIARFWLKELAAKRELLDSVAADINRVGGFVSAGVFAGDWELLTRYERFIVAEALNVFALTLTEGGDFLTTLTKREYENVLKELEDNLQQITEMPIRQSLLNSVIEAFASRKGFHFSCQEALLQIVLADMQTIGNDLVIARNLSKSEKILQILRQYPKGLAIHKDFNRFFERLNLLFPGEFNESERYIYAAIVNSDKTFLWGWGVYIHRDNAAIKKEDLTVLADWVKEKFAGGVEKLSAWAPFNEFGQLMVELEIPNEHALHSCLRHYYEQDFFMPKSPYIYPASIDQGRKNTSIVEEYIGDTGSSVSYIELKDEFINRRGWKEYTLNQAITLSRQIIRTARGEYGLLSFFPLATRDSLTQLADTLNLRLTETDQTSIRLLFAETRTRCRDLGINSDIALYSVLESRFNNLFSFYHYPYVRRKSVETDSVVNR